MNDGSNQSRRPDGKFGPAIVPKPSADSLVSAAASAEADTPAPPAPAAGPFELVGTPTRDGFGIENVPVRALRDQLVSSGEAVSRWQSVTGTDTTPDGIVITGAGDYGIRYNLSNSQGYITPAQTISHADAEALFTGGDPGARVRSVDTHIDSQIIADSFDEDFHNDYVMAFGEDDVSNIDVTYSPDQSDLDYVTFTSTALVNGNEERHTHHVSAESIASSFDLADDLTGDLDDAPTARDVTIEHARDGDGFTFRVTGTVQESPTLSRVRAQNELAASLNADRAGETWSTDLNETTLWASDLSVAVSGTTEQRLEAISNLTTIATDELGLLTSDTRVETYNADTTIFEFGIGRDPDWHEGAWDTVLEQRNQIKAATRGLPTVYGNGGGV